MFMPPEAMPKHEWGPGVWQDEPDRLEWVDGATGYKCLIKRTWTGNLCGYVGLSEAHPLYGRKYSDRITMDDAPNDWKDQIHDEYGAIPFFLESMRLSHYGQDGRIPIDCTISVHGGVTFTDMWPEEDDGLWYWGFDAGHCNDYQPGLIAVVEDATNRESVLRKHGTYRDIEYMRNECKNLAKQLKEIADGKGVRQEP